jgi:type II secretory pathway component PulF
VLVALRLFSGPRRATARDAGHLMINLIGWVLAALGLLAVLELCLGDALGVLFWLASLVVVGMALSRRRSAERNALLWVLAIAAERRMPLPAAADAFADEWGGRYAQQVRRLADFLRAGFSLPEALKRQKRTVSDPGLVAASAGSDSGGLGPALREAAVAGSLQEPLWQAVAGKLLYLYFATWMAIGVGMFLMVKIAPAMLEIFDDFEMELPLMTQLVFGASETFASLAVLLVPLQLLFGVLLPLYIVLYYLGWVHWRIPLLERITLRLETAVVLRSLALFAERGRPLLAALDSLSLVYPRRYVRRRLEGAYTEVLHGGDWCDSLESHGLVRATDVAVLRSAERAGNLPWALRTTAESNERRVVFRLQALLHVAFLVVLAGLAVAAAVFVTAFFLPLIGIIARMA